MGRIVSCECANNPQEMASAGSCGNRRYVQLSKRVTVSCSRLEGLRSLFDGQKGWDYKLRYNNIGCDKVTSFKENGTDCDIEEKSLFMIWKKMHDDVQTSTNNKEPEQNSYSQLEQCEERDINMADNSNNDSFQSNELTIQNNNSTFQNSALPFENDQSTFQNNIYLDHDQPSTSQASSPFVHGNLPSPFKKLLFCSKLTKEKKRRGERMPSAVVSEEWVNYHKNKVMKRIQVEEEEKRKAEARLENKTKKKIEAEEKKKKEGRDEIGKKQKERTRKAREAKDERRKA